LDRAKRKDLISALQDLQLKYNYLPQDAVIQLAKDLDIPLIDVYGVATFYRAFSLEPRGKHIITVCLGTACHVRGAPRIVEEFERRLSIKSGQTTDDNLFTLETVNCVGACALGPIAIIDGEYYGHMTLKKVELILSELREPEKDDKNKKHQRAVRV
jgi:NADH-quinone oxidoreductase subunit E